MNYVYRSGSLTPSTAFNFAGRYKYPLRSTKFSLRDRAIRGAGFFATQMPPRGVQLVLLTFGVFYRQMLPPVIDCEMRNELMSMGISNLRSQPEVDQ